MATLPCTPQLGSFMYLANLVELGGACRLRLLLVQNTTPPTTAAMRACATWQEMLTAGADEATFSGYIPGGKVVTASDITLTTNTGSRTQTLAVPTTYVWNPAGGAVNNTMTYSVLVWVPDVLDTTFTNWLPLGICTDATGSALGGSYTHTFGTIVATGPA